VYVLTEATGKFYTVHSFCTCSFCRYLETGAVPGAVVSREQLLSGGCGLLLTVGGCPASLRPHGSVHLPLLVGVAGAAGRGKVHSPFTLHLTPPETHGVSFTYILNRMGQLQTTFEMIKIILAAYLRWLYAVCNIIMARFYPCENPLVNC
jgi:hypothetical protein